MFQIATVLIGSIDSGRIEDTWDINGRLFVLQESGGTIFAQLDTHQFTEQRFAVEFLFVGGNENEGQSCLIRVLNRRTDQLEQVLDIDWQGIQQRIVQLPGNPEDYLRPNESGEIQIFAESDYSGKLQIDALAFLTVAVEG